MKRKFSDMRGESMLGILLTKLLCALFLAHGVQGKVSCYVCSWHSPTTYGSTNITDTCSHYHFDPAYSVTIECEGGCEAVSIRKFKNGDIVNFYKNCIPETKSSSKLEDKCISTDNQMEHITTCECTSDYCNTAMKTFSYNGLTSPLYSLLAIFIAFIPALFTRDYYQIFK